MSRLSSLISTWIFILTFSLPTLVFSSDVDVKSNPKTKIFQINIEDEITEGISRQFLKAMHSKEATSSNLILIHLNTYGGLLNAADSIRTCILNSKVRTIVFIDNNAASAGALISIACSKIYMRSGSSIGAATVVNESAEALPDKYQSYMRSLMRSTAETRGRDPRIAEAMVDQRISIPGVKDSGKVLTLTANEALSMKYCDGIYERITEVLKAENIQNYTITIFQPSWIDRLISVLILPAISGILILIMLGGIYYELQAPGIGFPIIAAIIAALLYFAPLYLEGLASNWEILIAVVGFLLLMAEIFVIPGFGIAGISGILFLVIGLTTSMLKNNGFDFSGVSMQESLTSLSIVVTSMLAIMILFITTGKALTNSPAFRKMVLTESHKSSNGFIVSTNNEIKEGDEGITASLMRPFGKVEINGMILSATCESGFIDQDEKIVVVKSGNTIVVKKVE